MAIDEQPRREDSTFTMHGIVQSKRLIEEAPLEIDRSISTSDLAIPFLRDSDLDRPTVAPVKRDQWALKAAYKGQCRSAGILKQFYQRQALN